MGNRPLRQFYDHDVTFDVDGTADDLIGPWRRHRRRFLSAVEGLTEEQWRATTRCDDWDAVDVVNHLVTADGFWIVSITGARMGAPTSFLRDFNPSENPGELIVSLRDDPIDEVLGRFDSGTNSFLEAVDQLDPDHWEAAAESPVGHVTARLALAHAFWDSWLHERDILVPLGLAPDPEPDELALAVWYSLFMGALQGGLVDDPDAVAPGPPDPIDVTLTFADLDGVAYRVQVDDGIRLGRGTEDVPGAREVEAMALVEGFTGRSPLPADVGLPQDLWDQVNRAGQVL